MSGYPCTCFDLCNIIFILSVLSLFFDHFHIFLDSRITSFSFILFELFHLIIRDNGVSNWIFFCKVILLRCYEDIGSVCE